MEDDNNNREEIKNKLILQEKINNKVKEIKENELILKAKLNHANSVLKYLLVAQKAYDDATKDDVTTEEEKKKKQVLEELLKEYDRAGKDYYDYDEKFLELIKNVENEYNIKAEDYYNEKAADQVGGKQKSKGNSKKVSKKPVVSQKKQSECKEILGKKMKIYKMPDSRKEYVKYKGELHHIADYKNLMKQKANAKQKAKTKPKK
jgi:hypothetical protein